MYSNNGWEEGGTAPGSDLLYTEVKAAFFYLKLFRYPAFIFGGAIKNRKETLVWQVYPAFVI